MYVVHFTDLFFLNTSPSSNEKISSIENFFPTLVGIQFISFVLYLKKNVSMFVLMSLLVPHNSLLHLLYYFHTSDALIANCQCAGAGFLLEISFNCRQVGETLFAADLWLTANVRKSILILFSINLIQFIKMCRWACRRKNWCADAWAAHYQSKQYVCG